MPSDDIKEGIEDVEEKDFENLRGKIIYESDYSIRNILIVGSFVFILLLFLGGWLFHRQTLSEEDFLEEKLRNPEYVIRMLAEVSSVIRNPQLSGEDNNQKRELMDAVRRAVDLTTTPLRVTDRSQVPYIPEREEALIEVLEGLLRLKTEGFIDFNDFSEKKYYEEILLKLGEQRLEYYENGVLESVPLMEQAWLKKEKFVEENRLGYKDERLLKELNEKLALVSKKESFSLLAPAYLLGRWYFFYNNVENAERCFHIGRKYVDGYTMAGTYYSGEKLETISPLWNEYAGCLEALAERAFEKKKYRQARSYLMRIFNTPKGINITYLNRSVAEQIESTKVEIKELNHDINVIRRVLSTVSDLPSFPFFHARDSILHWENLSAALGEGYSVSGKEVVDYVWGNLEGGIKSEIKKAKGSKDKKNIGISWLTYPMKERIVEVLNELIQDPTFFQRVFFNENKLSSRASKLLKKSENSSLPEEEYMFLNRDIIDTVFPKGIVNEYLLTDGIRLNNSLTREQSRDLMRIYQEEIHDANTDSHRRNYLKKEVYAIRNNEKHATLFDLQKVLKEKSSHIMQVIKENEIAFDAQRTVLSQISEEILELEERGGVDANRIFQLHSQEELARNRQRQSKIIIKQANTDLKGVHKKLGDLNKGFREKIENLESRLTSLLIRQERLRSKNLVERGPLAYQLENQIELRERYLSLLLGLKEQGDHIVLEELNSEREAIDRKISLLSEEVKKTSGDKREELENQLNDVENRKHYLLRKFNRIFDPLREVMDRIVVEEEEVWKIEELLRSTQEEIAKLVGDKSVSGLLREKTEKRSSLLLRRFRGDDGRKDPGEEVLRLNREIARDHARLQALLQTEKFAQSTLEAFYPFAEDHKIFSLREGDLLKLQNYLERQDNLMEEYEGVWREKVLQERISSQESVILENMQLISNRLLSEREFSDSQINDLSRYMENILLAKSILKREKGKLKAFVKNIGSRDRKPWAVEGTGYHLDTLEMFQMEKEIGLNISEYRRVFEERRKFVRQLQEALLRKKNLEEEKLQALRDRDQVKVDVIFPQIMEAERKISLLSQEKVEVDKRLHALAGEYARNLDEIHIYRKRLHEEIADVADRLGVIHRSMVKSDEQLESLSSEIFWTVREFGKAIAKLEVGDLRGIDQLIQEQKAQIERLRQVHEIRLREDFYKAKSLWMIGKSLDEQSRLKRISELVVSNDLPDEMVEDESRVGQLIVKEFNLDLAYSEEMFQGESEEEDLEEANRDMWIEFLEQGALRVFLEELPNYASNRMDMGSGYAGERYKKKENDNFIASSRFLSGDIYMRRALRFIRSSSAKIRENAQALQELDLARRSFLHYLDFTKSLERDSQKSTYLLTEMEFNTREFPLDAPRSFNLIDEARIYLGVIENLKGKYQDAIIHYREILTNMLHDVSNLEEKSEELVVGQVDPIVIEQYHYDSAIHPLYASLLARNPFSHEVLYRLGRSYSKLIEEESQRRMNAPADINAGIFGEDAITKHSIKAVAYYSQLILSQSYSPYRRSALLQRGLLRKRMGDYENARRDFVAILGNLHEKGGSFYKKDIDSKGDLPGELDPGYAYVAFELGKLYFENQDYAAAADIFRKAKEGDPDNVYVLQARIAYAKSLMKSENWLMADYFFSELAKEKEFVREEKEHHYHADILLDLAIVRKNMFNLEGAEKLFKAVFENYAPAELIEEEGDLSLINIHGLAILETDYRDSIRPLALSCLHLAEGYLIQRNYSMSKNYYNRAESLFKMLLWREDRILRNLSKGEFQLYLKEHILKSQWGSLKSDILELMFSTFADYRRIVGKGVESSDFVNPDKILSQIDRVIFQGKSQRESYEKMLRTVSDFYEEELEKLPEVVERKRIKDIREWDRKVGGESVKRYDALARLRGFIMERLEEPSETLIGELLKNFSRGSLEDVFLEEFSLFFAKDLGLTLEDREKMMPLNSNFDNLLEMKGASERLKNFSHVMRFWLEEKMRNTGIDDLFIPVSLQAKVLEEVDLFHVSLLSYLDTFDGYKKMVEISSRSIESFQAYPNRIQSPRVVWQLIEIVSMSADYREDWQRSEEYHRFLLHPEYRDFFIMEDGSDRYRAQLGYAKALLECSREKINELAHIGNEAKKMEEQEKLEEKLEKARELLMELSSIEGENGFIVSARIRAKEMLKDLGSL